jgi:hypothetical protein
MIRLSLARAKPGIAATALSTTPSTTATRTIFVFIGKLFAIGFFSSLFLSLALFSRLAN